MQDLVDRLSVDDIIEFHSCCQQLMKHQITEAGDKWLIELNKNIGIERIFKWAAFIGGSIGEDFRDVEFKQKARNLSKLIQHKFSSVGLDISLWSPIFFYLGMIYTYAKHIGFVKITHKTPNTKVKAISRLDIEFAEAIQIDEKNKYLFVDSRKEDPMIITQYIIELGILDLESIDIFVEFFNQVPSELSQLDVVRIHQIRSEIENPTSDQKIISYWK